MNYGMMVPITESIDFSTAAVVGEELGITVKPEAVPEPEVAEVEEELRSRVRQRILAGENPRHVGHPTAHRYGVGPRRSR